MGYVDAALAAPGTALAAEVRGRALPVTVAPLPFVPPQRPAPRLPMKYTEDHEWLRPEGDDIVVVGITEHAAKELGDVVFVQLPEVDAMVASGDEVVVIESVKAASDILAPVDGEIVEVNSALADNPGLVNADPTGAGWFFKIKVDDLSVLDDFMDEDEYQDHIA
jgi:glycine cleavage system H protein